MSEEPEEGIEMKKKGSSATLMKRPLLDTSTADAEELPVAAAAAVELAPLEALPGASLEPAEAADPHTGAAAGAAKSSTLRACLNTIKSIVGVGILSFPFAIR